MRQSSASTKPPLGSRQGTEASEPECGTFGEQILGWPHRRSPRGDSTHSHVHSFRTLTRNRLGGGRKVSPLTALRSVSQVLERGHGCLRALNVLFGFRDVHVLGGGLLGGFCGWLNKNTPSE